LIERRAGRDADVGERTVAIIAEKDARRGIAGDVDVGPAVVIKVAGYDGEAKISGGLGETAGFRDVREFTAADIAIERVGPAHQAARATHYRYACVHTQRVCAGLGCFGGFEADVVGDGKVEPAITIVIEEGAARAPASRLVKQAGGFGDVAKGSVTFVVIKNVLAPIG